MLWDVSYSKEGDPSFEIGYQGRSRLLAWIYVQRLRASGYQVRVMVKPDGSIGFRVYAYYMPFDFSRMP